MVRADADGARKYSLSNAPAQTSRPRLGRLQGQRHFIERMLEDGKSQVGMGQYHARQWRAWQHHMALVGLALLFVLEERLWQKTAQALLSTRDIVEMLDWCFRGPRSAREVEAGVRRRPGAGQKAGAQGPTQNTEEELTIHPENLKLVAFFLFSAGGSWLN